MTGTFQTSTRKKVTKDPKLLRNFPKNGQIFMAYFQKYFKNGQISETTNFSNFYKINRFKSQFLPERQFILHREQL